MDPDSHHTSIVVETDAEMAPTFPIACASFTRTTCAGDAHGDGSRNMSDSGVLQLSFGTSLRDSDHMPDSDLNDDGMVDLADLTILSGDSRRGKYVW